MEGLKNLIYAEISKSGYMSVDTLNQICDDNGYKRSNGERRLRTSESHNIIPIKNKKHHITGYRLVDTINSSKSCVLSPVKPQDALFDLSEIEQPFIYED